MVTPVDSLSMRLTSRPDMQAGSDGYPPNEHRHCTHYQTEIFLPSPAGKILLVGRTTVVQRWFWYAEADSR